MARTAGIPHKAMSETVAKAIRIQRTIRVRVAEGEEEQRAEFQAMRKPGTTGSQATGPLARKPAASDPMSTRFQWGR